MLLHLISLARFWVSLDENRKVAHRLLAEKIAYFGPGLGELNLKRLGLTKQDFAAIESMLFDKKDLDNASKMVDNRMMKIGIVGQPQEIIERLCPLIEAGMQHLSFGPPLGANRIQTIKLLGKHVLPFFRQKSEPEKAKSGKSIIQAGLLDPCPQSGSIILCQAEEIIICTY